MSTNENLEKKFGAKLAYIRKSKKLSQMKLAEKVDMNFNYIGQIERGEANVTIKTIKVLADALQVEVHELLDFRFYFVIIMKDLSPRPVSPPSSVDTTLIFL